MSNTPTQTATATAITTGGPSATPSRTPTVTHTYTPLPTATPSSPFASATFYYDGDGRRVQAIINGVTTTYVGNYYEETGGTVTKYYYAGAQRVAMRTGNTVHYLFSDHASTSSAQAWAPPVSPRMQAVKGSLSCATSRAPSVSLRGCFATPTLTLTATLTVTAGPSLTQTATAWEREKRYLGRRLRNCVTFSFRVCF